MTFKFQKKKRMLMACLGTTVLLHAAGLYIFYKHPIVVQTHAPLFDSTSSVPETLQVEENEAILKHALENVQLSREMVFKPYDLLTHLNEYLYPKKESVSYDPHPSLLAQTFPLRNDSSNELVTRPTLLFPEDMSDSIVLNYDESESCFYPQIEIDKENSLDITREFSRFEPVFVPESDDSGYAMQQSDTIVASAEDSVGFLEELPSAEEQDAASVLHINPLPPLNTPTPALEIEIADQTEDSFILPKPPARTYEKKLKEIPAPPSPRVKKQLEKKPLPKLPKKQLPKENLLTDMNIQLMPHPDGNEYVFSLTLPLQWNSPEVPIKHHLYFILDKSYSIEKHRYNVFKKAVIKALSFMQEGMDFNIYVYDKKCIKLNDRNLPFSPSSLRMAEEFLESEKPSRQFSAADMFSNLDSLIPENLSPDDLHTAILITDGNGMFDLKKQRVVLRNWTKKNRGKINLYTAAVGKENNLMLLDLISSCHRGRLLYSETYAAFPRKLSKLVLSLRNPVATNLMITAIPSDPKAKVTLHDSRTQCATLFKDVPFNLLGTVDRLCDVEIWIRAIQNEQNFSKKIPISFEKSKKGSKTVEKQWALYQANVSYERFIKEGKNAHLKKAQQCLIKAGGEVAFESMR